MLLLDESDDCPAQDRRGNPAMDQQWPVKAFLPTPKIATVFCRGVSTWEHLHRRLVCPSTSASG